MQMRPLNLSALSPFSTILSALFSFLLSLNNVCSAQEAPPLPVKGSDLPLYEHFHPQQGTYYYDVLWEGISVGRIALSLSTAEESYKIRVQAKTGKKLDTFYRLRYQGEVEMKPDALTPRTVTIEETSPSKRKNTTVSFPERNRAESITIEKKKGKKAQIKESEGFSDTFIIDPFSVIFLIRNLDWHIGMAEVFDIFTGEKQYTLYLHCEKRTLVKTKKNKQEAFIIHPVIRNPQKKDQEPNTSFRVYLSTDNKREILKIEGVPRVGKVEARMSNWTGPTSKSGN